jgi:histidine ammonia-lyase
MLAKDQVLSKASQKPARRTLVVGRTALTIEDVCAVAREGLPVELDRDPAYRQQIEAGTAFLDRMLKEEGVIYGVTTGYGDSCTNAVPGHLVEELPLQLSRFHGCGLGAHLSHVQARAVLVTRLASLSRGYSGVRWELLSRLAELLNLDIAPVIPEEGSVGASGDLTPLSYLVSLLVGEREASYRGAICDAGELLDRLSLTPLTLRPKEGLAVMNGTAVMTALACEAYRRAEYLTRLTARLTALSSIALCGNRYHFDERLFEVKPHPGQCEIAAWIRQDLNVGEAPRNAGRLQDRYSIRCAPHVIDVLRDSLAWMRAYIETELNSANDNPIIDAEGQHVLHGGHFYGGHVAFAMDGMKTCVANLADLMDRQLALLVDPKFNHGLPANLSGASDARAAINHGFKAVQIGASAWTAEALKLTMPASVFSRSTECHNQDKVSMGTIAARDCLRVLQLTEQVAAAQILAVIQAIQLRRREAGASADFSALSRQLLDFVESVSAAFAFLEEDRALEPELRAFVGAIQEQRWSLYDQ